MSAATAAIIGAAVGGTVSIIAGLVTTYFGPRWLAAYQDKKQNAPRRRLLRDLLEDERWRDGRTLERLAFVTGTSEEQCRQLLVEIDARGVTLSGDREGWALIKYKPLGSD
jgi:hypothetical protein